jgi:hypothetical protein
MRNTRAAFILILGLLTASGILCDISGSITSGYKPFRVAVIIGDQWDDPMSYMVTAPNATGDYSGYGDQPGVPGPKDFHHLMIMLKSWAIPFDVIRLDQQYLDRNMFLNATGEPIYGTVIWDVNQSEKLLDPDYSIIQEMVEKYGIGLIALSDRISQPEIQSILGIRNTGTWMSRKPLTVAGNHFITEGLNPTFNIEEGHWGNMNRQEVETQEGIQTVVLQGEHPQVTARELKSGAHVVWIGHDHNYMFYYQDVRTLLRRAITWTIGYNLYKTWDEKIIMILDDPGTAQNVWLEHWRYPALTKEVIDQYLIQPLKEHDAILNINFVPGFVNDQKQQIEPTWRQKFVDAFGTSQDYISAKEGFDLGVEAKVFEVMCHGLTHMQPDLTSAPGWWGSELDRERAEVGWYREFGDTRRGAEIPAAEQMWRMKTSNSWLISQFDVIPLAFTPGGAGSSISYENSTARIAGRAGFGWYGWSDGYLGKDMVIVDWDFSGTPETPLFVSAPPNGHDFGIATDPEKFATIFESHPESKFISINEFIGYLHAANSGQMNLDNSPMISFEINYDPHYCQYFNNHSSTYTIELADWVANEFDKNLEINVDGEIISPGQLAFEIEIPAGIRVHHIDIHTKCDLYLQIRKFKY